MLTPTNERAVSDREGRWSPIADRALAGASLKRGEALEVLRASDEELRSLLWAAFRVRSEHFGCHVKLCVLQNARSGLCPEDCHYCSQSSVSTADIDRYRLLSEEKLVQGAEHAASRGAGRYCMVTSGRGPSATDIRRFASAARAIRSRFPELELCVSLGLLGEEAARELREAGIGWVNHNLNTSERFHPEICTTHTYRDRVETLRNVKSAGLAVCSGGILGMGENDDDVVDLAFALREIGVDSLPINLLHPIEGTPFEGSSSIEALRALRALCLFRFTNPTADVRAAGGRERNLGEWQALAVFPATSIFVQGYLTTPGQSPEDASEMIRSLGFEIEEPDLNRGPRRSAAGS